MVPAHLSASFLHLVKKRKNSRFVAKSPTSISIRTKSQQPTLCSMHKLWSSLFSGPFDMFSLITEVELPITLQKHTSLLTAYPNTGSGCQQEF